MHPTRHAAATASAAFPPISSIRAPARATSAGSEATAPRLERTSAPSISEDARASSAGWRDENRAAPATVAPARDESRTNSRRVRTPLFPRLVASCWMDFMMPQSEFVNPQKQRFFNFSPRRHGEHGDYLNCFLRVLRASVVSFFGHQVPVW